MLPPDVLDELTRRQCPVRLNTPRGEMEAIAWLAERRRADEETARRSTLSWRVGFWVAKAIIGLAVIVLIPIAMAVGILAAALMLPILLPMAVFALCRWTWREFRALVRP